MKYVASRALQAIVSLLLLSVVIFILARLMGDPLALMLPADATLEDEIQMRQALGLDKPYIQQYAIFITQAVQGDFGNSMRSRRPVMELIGSTLPNSIKLSVASMIFALLLAIPLGVIAAVKRNTSVDTVAKVFAVLGQSVPSFWLAIILIEFVAVRIRILPVSGIGGIDHYILPAFTLGWFITAGIMRLMRSGMLESLDSEFIKMARIKGVSEGMVIWKHALRNALIPVITFSGMYFAILITSAIVTETVFAWPGLGRLAYTAIVTRDLPIVQGIVLVAAFIVVVINLFVDIVYGYIDPRIRYG